MLTTLTVTNMPKTPRPEPGLDDGTAESEVSKTPAAALRAKTRVVTFDDFQTSFFPKRTETDGPKPSSDSAEGSNS